MWNFLCSGGFVLLLLCSKVRGGKKKNVALEKKKETKLHNNSKKKKNLSHPTDVITAQCEKLEMWQIALKGVPGPTY